MDVLKKYEDFPVPRQPYTGDEIRLNGYYYQDYLVNSEVELLGRRFVFFFANGLYLRGSHSINTTTGINEAETEEEFRNGIFYNKVREDRYHWAAFFVNGNSITIHGWDRAGGYGKKYKLRQDYMTIIDRDNIRDSNGNVYKFKEFYGKPDSVCRFIP